MRGNKFTRPKSLIHSALSDNVFLTPPPNVAEHSEQQETLDEIVEIVGKIKRHLMSNIHNNHDYNTIS